MNSTAVDEVIPYFNLSKVTENNSEFFKLLIRTRVPNPESSNPVGYKMLQKSVQNLSKLKCFNAENFASAYVLSSLLKHFGAKFLLQKFKDFKSPKLRTSFYDVFKACFRKRNKNLNEV